MKTLVVTLLSFLFLTSTFAQKPPMKWGKVPKEDLAMSVYEPDPDAAAVVLGDIGRITFDLATGDILYQLEYHKRIKILKKSAFDRGDIRISFYTSNNYEAIKGLKAQVILPNGDKIAVKKFFEEKVNDDYSIKKFAFPNLTEGCVIEYKYTKVSKGFYNLEDWYFQGDLPVRLSQLTTEIPEWYHYVSFAQGRKTEVEKTTKNAQIIIPGGGSQVKKGQGPVGNRVSRITYDAHDQVNAKVVITKYKMENAPALEVEPYITTMQDYYSKIQFQLQTVQYPGGTLRNAGNSWDKLENELMEHSRFGDQINKKRFSKKMWSALEPILATAKSEEEKVTIIYKFISSNLIWDETYSILIDKTLDDAFERKSANSGELNLMLIAICKQVNMEAHPILISTRSHGKMLPYYPKIDQFNHVLAFVQIGDKEFVFDVGSSFRSPELLRENSLNYNGWLVQANKSEWIPINSPTDREVCMANFDLLPDGQLIGSINQSYKGYGAMSKRMACYKDDENKNIKNEWTDKFVDIKIDSIHHENEKNLSKSFKTKIYCTIPDAVQTSGDFIYISPVLDAYTENPFKLKERAYSIDMTYGFKNQYILNLTIPDGYVVDELPEALNMELPNKGGKFQFFISQNGNIIQIVNKLSISQLRFEPEEYGAIKSFFDIIVEKHSEQIVLKKAT
jgi:Domain of Unknown Function with PDB structure (DUF3857)